MEALTHTPSVSLVLKEFVGRYLNGRSRALRRLTGVRLSEAEASALWPRLLEHKWYVGERLGRDVGLRVAAVDYLENVERPHARVSFRVNRDALPPRLPMMMPFGERR
jgi:Domain of unknown function (DUF4032)